MHFTTLQNFKALSKVKMWKTSEFIEPQVSLIFQSAEKIRNIWMTYSINFIERDPCNAPIFSLSDFPRVDEQLKTLVYKLVPGLYHNEIERQLQWGSSDGKDEAVNQDSEEDFFSPVEPIR